MNPYLKELAHLISNCKMTNTYKMSWARAITEYLVTNSHASYIHFDDLSPLIFKYYWNQIVFFDLKQSPDSKTPVICQIVKNEIVKRGNLKPEVFTKIEHQVEIPIKQISDTLKEDVSHRFLNLEGEKFKIYDLDESKRTLAIREPKVFRDYSDIIFHLINYRWAQKLEECNSSPRISKKVRGTDREKIKRGNLSKFKEYLYLENPERRCFITDEKISEDESVDHVIPWSYLYSDDLWNLVLVKKGANSSKSNNIPDEGLIEKLEQRNRRLLDILKDQKLDKKIENRIEELELAIDNDYVRKFWTGCRG
ncbi:HNH endonuclease [Gammaproteobacteria bacterium]|nr:HNH endonuclease [Gammaproteobacteria bacterium]